MIIYILGEAHSGKSKAADYLSRTHKCTEISLADPMKRFLMDLYEFTEDQLWGPSSARNTPDMRYMRDFVESPTFSGSKAQSPVIREGLSPREALQTLGEAMRKCYSETYVRVLLRDIARLAEATAPGGNCYPSYFRALGVNGLWHSVTPPNFLVPDVRYRNEHDALRKRGGLGFRLVSPHQGKGLTGKLALHPSEVEQRTIPDSELAAVIRNDGTLDDLYAKIEALVTQHLIGS